MLVCVVPGDGLLVLLLGGSVLVAVGDRLVVLDGPTVTAEHPGPDGLGLPGARHAHEPAPSASTESPDTSAERKALGIQPRDKVDTEGWPAPGRGWRP